MKLNADIRLVRIETFSQVHKDFIKFLRVAIRSLEYEETAYLKVLLFADQIRIEVIKPLDAEIIEAITQVVQDDHPDVNVTLEKKSKLPDDLVYKQKQTRGSAKEKHREDFWKNIKDEDLNPEGKENFDKLLKGFIPSQGEGGESKK